MDRLALAPLFSLGVSVTLLACCGLAHVVLRLNL